MEYGAGRSAGSLPRRSHVVITTRPSGRRTRATSRSSPFLSGTNCRESMHTTASAVLAGSDVSAASATMNDARGRGTNASARRDASAIAAGEKSTRHGADIAPVWVLIPVVDAG